MGMEPILQLTYGRKYCEENLRSSSLNETIESEIDLSDDDIFASRMADNHTSKEQKFCWVSARTGDEIEFFLYNEKKALLTSKQHTLQHI
uniref:Uncharacterized protein n=1 Tax=Romanomermis culicivorax TaxID=13658 RepID=A0A915KXB0_ROMCU